jgi:DNA polymerase-4
MPIARLAARAACVLIHNLPVQLEQQRRGTQLPLIVPHPIGGQTVLAFSPELAEAGLVPGMSLYQAQQNAPAALVVEPDELAYHACHSAVEARLKAFSPVIETVDLGEFLIDVRVRAPELAADAALVEALLAAAQAASGLAAQVSLGVGKFTVMQAARRAPLGGGLVVPPGGEAHFLAPLPLGVLPNLPGELRRRLNLFDLHTLGDLAALRKPAVLRQFGGELAGLFELARGNDPRALNPDVPPLRLVRSMTLPEPVGERPPLLRALQRLSWQISRDLERRGCHAEALKLTLLTESGQPLEAAQAAKPPTCDEARLSRLAALLLGKLNVAAPVHRVALSAYPLRAWHLGWHQLTLRDQSAGDRAPRLEEALQLLAHRFGQAMIRVAALLGPPVPVPIGVSLDSDGRPARLRVGGQMIGLAGVDDHWREERQWWEARGGVRRDYFRVVLPDGTLRKIFQNLADGEWYLDRSWPLL